MLPAAAGRKSSLMPRSAGSNPTVRAGSHAHHPTRSLFDMISEWTSPLPLRPCSMSSQAEQRKDLNLVIARTQPAI